MKTGCLVCSTKRYVSNIFHYMLKYSLIFYFFFYILHTIDQSSLGCSGRRSSSMGAWKILRMWHMFWKIASFTKNGACYYHLTSFYVTFESLYKLVYFLSKHISFLLPSFPNHSLGIAKYILFLLPTLPSHSQHSLLIPSIFPPTSFDNRNSSKGTFPNYKKPKLASHTHILIDTLSRYDDTKSLQNFLLLKNMIHILHILL